MKVVVTGASGLLGRAIVHQFRQQDHEVHGLAFTRSTHSLISLDLTDFPSVETYLSNLQPDLIIHTAAERRPDVVSKDPQRANLLNVDVPAHLAKYCNQGLESKPLFINISTDYVFDGNNPPYKVNDDCNPLNDYGTSKLLGEREIEKNGRKGRATSLRVPILYGEAETPSESAVNILLESIKPTSTPLKTDAYSVRYPTNTKDVSKVLYDLVTLTSQIQLITLPPILHFQSKEAMTKFDISCVLDRVNNSILNNLGDVSDDYYQRFRTSVNHLEPEYQVDNTKPGSVARPKHCKLDMEELDLLGVEVDCVGFEEWWREYLTKQHKERIAKEKEEAELKRIEEEKELERLRIEKKEEEERKRKEEEEAREKEIERQRLEKEAEDKIRREEERIAEEKRLKEEEDKKKAEEERKPKEEEEKLKKEQEVKKESEETEEAVVDKSKEVDQEQQSSEPTSQVQVSSDTTSESQQENSSSTNETTSSPIGRDSATNQDSSLNSNPLSPSSPNPSFSSLRARPTPPTTSLNSPTNSLPPSVYEGKIGEIINKEEKKDESHSFDSPLSLNVDENTRTSKAGPKPNLKIGNGVGLFENSNDLLTSNGRKDLGGDGDSDGYGQPSPKLNEFKEEVSNSIDSSKPTPTLESSSTSSEITQKDHNESKVEPNSLTKNGFGEVSFGLDNEESNDGNKNDNDDDDHEKLPNSKNTNLIGIPRPPLPKQKEKAKEDDLPWFQVKVGDPIKVGDPVTAHIVYTVRTKTNSPLFKSQQFSVLRRYSDFRWLHAALVHCNPGIFIPPIPEKVKLGRFQPELIESRRIGLENAVNKMLKHRKLYKDEDLKMFLESENFAIDVKAREARKGAIPTPEQKTYFGWSSAITNNGPKFHEFDEWFDSQRMYLDSLESQLKQLVKAVSAVAQQRKELAAATSDFSSTLMALSFSSLSRSLSTCFAGLGELEKRNAELTDDQSDADVRQIGTVIYEYERMVGSVRKAFATRIDSWVSWQKSNEEFSKQQARHEKLKRETNGRIHPDKLHTSLTDLSESEIKSLNLKREFETISKNCKEEMDRFDKVKVEEFKQALENWIDGMIQRQEEIIAEWEQYNALLDRQSGGTQPAASQNVNPSNAQTIPASGEAR